MLHVFHTNEEREQVHDEMVKSPSMGMKSFPSGITPPTYQIVKKKFSKTSVLQIVLVWQNKYVFMTQ